MPERNLDLFTGAVLVKPKTAKSGSKASSRRQYKPRQVEGVCLWCRKTFDTDAEMCLPTLAGWLHYRCYVNKADTDTAVAKQSALFAA